MKPFEVENMSITFGKVTVLPAVSFQVEAGECFGLVGESGSGKSTVLRCASMLLNLWDGDALIGGKSAKNMQK